jgi:hypothetical protein
MKETYIIVEQESAALLAQEVQKKIREGYFPIGGVAIVFTGTFLQAMVLVPEGGIAVAPGFNRT